MTGQSAKKAGHGNFIERFKTAGIHQFNGSLDGIAMKICHTGSFIRYIEPFVQSLFLRGHAHWTFPTIAFQRLYASQRKHHSPGAIAGIGAQCQHFKNIEAGNDFAGGNQFHMVFQII